MVEFHYNTVVHSGLCISPFEAMYGRRPLVISDYLSDTTAVDALHSILHDRHEKLQVLRESLTTATTKMKLYADTRRTDISFAEGDLVWVQLHPYRQLSVVRRVNQKLSKRFFGPYKVLQHLGPVAYKLDLPLQSHIHPIFHVSLLKKFIGQESIPCVQLHEVDNCIGPVLFPQHVLDSREIQNDGATIPQVLVKLETSPDQEATWFDLADYEALQNDSHHEDMVILKARGIDTIQKVIAGLAEPEQETEQLGMQVAEERPRRKTTTPAWLKEYEVSERQSNDGRKKGG